MKSSLNIYLMKAMKKFKFVHMKTIIHSIVFLVVSSPILAQKPASDRKHEGREKIIAMKVAYIKDNLGLTEEESARFLPVYEVDLRKEETLRKKQRGIMRQVKQHYQELSESEIDKQLYEEMQLEQQLLDLKKSQYESYKKLIPIKKIVELKLVERDFNRMLMDKLRQQKGKPPVQDNER